ncbi:chemotaxis protein CheR [bacterium]|nr:MAG: chemotaxis protein CheR [bacterium]
MYDRRDATARGLMMNGRDFDRLSELIQARCGIRITASKKLMLESRLRRRLRSLGMSSFSEYCAYLFSPGGMRDELVKMIDEVTTNTTSFFREPVHFEYLGRKIVPEFISARAGRKLKVWSAGCSSGEEPYTLEMVLSESFPDCSASGIPILATDICTRVLEKARLGIYEDERTASVPWEFKRKYFMTNRDRNKGLVRIVPELRRLVRFRTLNLVDDDFCLAEQWDVIFCRNVIIYFDRSTQERLIRKLCTHLSPGGHLFLGHSETLTGLDVPLVRVESTIYRKQV